MARILRDYDLIRLNPRAAAVQIRNTGRLFISTSQGDFDLQLAPHDMRAPDYVSQLITADGVAHKLEKEPINTYKGTVAGYSSGQVRMTVKESSVEGVIITGTDRFFIQLARSLSKIARDDEYVLYRSSDVANEGATCGVTLADEVEAQEARAGSHLNAGESPGELGPINGLSPLKIARLATDADAEYVSALGGASQANAQITSIMNLVDGIYQVETGIAFQITFQNAWADAGTDPYTSTNPGNMLDEFLNHWNLHFTGIQRSLAHLWTGKNLNGGTIGVASLAVVCRTPQRAYGLSQKFPLSGTSITASTVVLTAHEIGHNFSAFHTDPEQPNSVVPPDIKEPCQQPIMEAFIGNGSSFCPFSRSQIIGHAFANSSCLLNSASGPPPFPPCIEISIDPHLFANGTVSTGDCRSQSRGVGHFADRYSFNATAGEQLTITMSRTTGNLDPYLYLIGPDGYVVVQDDDSDGSQNSRIPASGQFTLPLTGRYILEATSFGADQIGNYTVNVTKANCTLTVGPSSQHFPASGGAGTLSVTGVGTCPNYAFSSTAPPWLVHLITGGSGSSTLAFRVDPNSNAAGRRGFLLVGAFSTADGQFGGLRVPITQSGTGPDCALTPIAFGQTMNGDLSTSDCQSPVRGDGFFTDRYVFNALAGQQVSIDLSSRNAPDPDTFLTLIGPNGVVILTDDDSGGFTNSLIPGGPGFLTLGLPGAYIIEVGAFTNRQTGPYTLNLTASFPSSSVSFESAALTVSEGADANGIGFEGTGFRTITVQRSGDVSGAVSVDYGTSNVSALAGRDYAPSLGTLRFAPNEAAKTFVVFIIDDVFQEVPETVNLSLTNPVATTLGSNPTTVLTINSNDATTGPNPVDPNSFSTGFFVRQHYSDFLTREPDLGGLNFWKNQIDECTNEPCREDASTGAAGGGGGSGSQQRALQPGPRVDAVLRLLAEES
ncbi:MAG: M12 family metallo-peptidase [Pyrinomonadaceae bacterium]